MSLNLTYSGGTTPNIEGYDCTGMQGVIVSLVGGEATPASPPLTIISLTWWDGPTQQTIIAQQLYEVNSWRETIITLPVLGKWLTIGVPGSTQGVWTNVQMFAYPLPFDAWDVPTPYGRTWSATAPWVPDSVPGNDGILIQKTSAGTACAVGQLLTWYMPISPGEIEVSVFGPAGALLSIYQGSLDRTTFTVPSSGTDGHFRLFTGRRACRLTISNTTAAGTVYIGANRHLPGS